MTPKLRTGFLTAFCLIALPSLAYADCANPTGTLGEIFYNGDYQVMQFCDGTDWIGMGGGSGGGGAGVTDGDKGDITVSGSGASWLIDDDLLDFTEFADALSLDASTDIAISGSQVFSLTNTGTGASFVVNDQASDTTPFVIDAAGNVGIGIGTPTQALDVVGKTASNSFILKPLAGAAAPTGGSSPSAQWSTDGTHVWRAAANVGIGTASPGHTLEVVGSSALRGTSSQLRLIETDNADPNDSWHFSMNGGSLALVHADASAGPAYTFAMNLSPSGNVGIGTASPAAKFHVKNGKIAASDNDSSPVGSWGSNFNHAFLDPSGYIWSTMTASAVSANLYLHRYNTSSHFIQFGYNGSVVGTVSTNGSSVAYNTTSDYRLKENVDGIADALSKIGKLKPVHFSFRNDPTHEMTDGFLAHEVEPVAPYAVTGMKDAVDGDGKPVYQQVDYGKLTPLLVAAIQELKAANDNLRAEIEALKAAR